MNILLIFSIFIFCLLIGKINKKNIKNSIYIAIAIIFTPIIFLNKIDTQTLIAFIFSLLLLIIFDLIKNKVFKKILISIISLYFVLVVLYLSGILNNKLAIDFQKLFIIDNSNFEIIKRFQLDALYLPKIIRPIIYNYFQIIFMVIIRSLNYLWIDKIITYLGFAFIYLTYIAFTKKKDFLYLIIPILIVITGTLHRDPNNIIIYLFSIPIFLLFFVKNINKINIPLLFTTISISCLYSFL
jgi:hypothetical protein